MENVPQLPKDYCKNLGICTQPRSLNYLINLINSNGFKFVFIDNLSSFCDDLKFDIDSLSFTQELYEFTKSCNSKIFIVHDTRKPRNENELVLQTVVGSPSKLGIVDEFIHLTEKYKMAT